MESKILVGTINQWDEEKERYELSESFDLGGKSQVDFGGITIQEDSHPPYYDYHDQSQSIVLRKEKEQQITTPLHVFEQRNSHDKPKEYVVGKTIMVRESLFYLSNLSDLVYLQIYKGDPKDHPEMLEIKLAHHVGESPSSSLL